MTSRRQDVMVGLTSILGIAALVAVLLLFGWAPKFIQPGYRMTVDLQDAAGLRGGSRVRYLGIDVGEVEQVVLDPASPRGVVALLKINDGRQVPEGTIAQAEAQLLGGLSALMLVPPKAEANASHSYLATDGSARINGEISSVTAKLTETMTKAVGNMSGQFTALNDQFTRMADAAERLGKEFEALGKEWTTVGTNINQMIEPRNPGDVDAGKAQGNLSSAIARADASMKDMTKIVKDFDALVNDPQMRSDIKLTLSNARRFSEKMNTGADNVNALTDDARKSLDDLAKRYAKVADNLELATTSLRSVMAKVDKGNGTLGKMVNDPAVYDNVNNTVERIGEAMAELKMLVQKWNKEGLPLKLE